MAAAADTQQQNSDTVNNNDNDTINTNDDDTDSLFDFSYLPETIWVKVFEHLSIRDQYRVSMTCRNLYDIFNHPTNWKTASLSAVGGGHNFKMLTTFVSDKFKVIVEKFGHFFQRLTVTFTGHLVRMDDDTKEILSHMSQVCRLEHLVMEVGLLTSDFHLYGYRPQEDALRSILALVSSAFRLKKLEILSWPMFPEVFENPELNVFEVMKSNPKLESLQSLSLFWMKNKQWTERMPLLPSPDYTLSLVAHFHSLRHLAIRSPMLSDALILELASVPRRAKLDTLRILLSFVAQERKHGIPEVSSASWSALVKSSPQLQVEVAVMSRVSDVDMGAFLRPEIPLTQLKILKFARCSETLISSLTDKFRKSLQSFICYTDPSDCERELLRLATCCDQLHTLVFHGQVSYGKLMSIVKAKESWEHLDFVERNVLTNNSGDGYDEDAVIARDDAGDLVQLSLLRFHGEQTEEEREELLSALKAEVTTRVGHTWTLSKATAS